MYKFKGTVESVLQHLLAVSLVEQYEVQGEQTTYQVAALVRSWLLANGTPEPTQALLQAAAEFLHWQLENRLNTTWEHRLATHAALTAANLIEAAHSVVLAWIVGPLNRAGMYRTLLDDWLLNPKLKMAEATNPQIKGDALNQIGEQYFHLGNYDTAQTYYQQSLAIRQEIGDKSGEGTTLNNISQIFKARGDYHTALDFLQQSLAITKEIGDVAGLCGTTINIGHIYWQNDQQKEALLSWIAGYQMAKKIGYAQALQALESMAGQLGLEGGLQGWEMLAQDYEQTGKISLPD